MSTAEYLAFVPLLFYGIALADLFRQWRRLFEFSSFCLPYFLTTLVFTELAIWNVYGYLGSVDELEYASYVQYWSFLLQPILFLLTVSAMTPEAKDHDITAFFERRIRWIYGLMACFLLTNFALSFDGLASLITPRFLAIVLLVAVAISRRIEICYVLFVVWLGSLYFRLA